MPKTTPQRCFANQTTLYMPRDQGDIHKRVFPLSSYPHPHRPSTPKKGLKWVKLCVLTLNHRGKRKKGGARGGEGRGSTSLTLVGGGGRGRTNIVVDIGANYLLYTKCQKPFNALVGALYRIPMWDEKLRTYHNSPKGWLYTSRGTPSGPLSNTLHSYRIEPKEHFSQLVHTLTTTLIRPRPGWPTPKW